MLAEHQAVSATPDLEVADSVDIDALEELGGVGPLHLDLAEGRGVEQPDLSAQREHLARDRRMFVFTGTGEIGGSQTQAVIFHPGACRDRRCIDRKSGVWGKSVSVRVELGGG